MMFLFGPVTTTLCQKFGCRKIGVLGGFLCMLGMVASAHAQSLHHLYVSFGLTWGLGTSFCYFPTLIILVPYFDKRLALVNGIVSAGSGAGTLVLSPFIQWFAQNYGVKNMFFILASIHGIVFIAAFVYRPINDKYKLRQGIKVKERVLERTERQYTKETLLSIDSRTAINTKETFLSRSSMACVPQKNVEAEEDEERRFRHIVLVSLFWNKAFVTWCLGLSVFMLGYFVPFVHLVSIFMTARIVIFFQTVTRCY